MRFVSAKSWNQVLYLHVPVYSGPIIVKTRVRIWYETRICIHHECSDPVSRKGRYPDPVSLKGRIRFIWRFGYESVFFEGSDTDSVSLKGRIRIQFLCRVGSGSGFSEGLDPDPVNFHPDPQLLSVLSE